MVVTTIRASCPSCGDVDLTVGDVSVRVCANDQSGSYTFRCPGCAMAVAKHADPNVVELLVSSGVRMAVWELPGELCEPHVGEPISHDDLLDFHDLLADDRWFDRLTALVESESN
jgi:rRNA maturation protein Nop10